MSAYADAHLANSEPEDYGEKECPTCLGDTHLCRDCEERCDDCECKHWINVQDKAQIICPECDGSGTIPKDIDDAIDDEWDARCED